MSMLASWVPVSWGGYKRGLRRKPVSRGCYHHHYTTRPWISPPAMSALRSISPLAYFQSLSAARLAARGTCCGPILDGYKHLVGSWRLAMHADG